MTKSPAELCGTGDQAELEVCIDSVASAHAAFTGGAQRVELCANLHEGGTTPSYGLIKMVRSAFPAPRKLTVLVRCRGGDFCYTPAELQVMAEDLECCSQLAVDAVAIGCLAKDGSLDEPAFTHLLRLAVAKGLEVTFHRAFDMAHDQSALLQQLITLGVHRVLTSGGQPSALAGAGMLAQLVGEAGRRIAVVAGGGLTEENVVEVVRRSGVRCVHSSAKRSVFSQMAFKKRGMSLCSTQLPLDYAWGEAQQERVAAVLAATQLAVASLP